MSWACRRGTHFETPAVGGRAERTPIRTPRFDSGAVVHPPNAELLRGTGCITLLYLGWQAGCEPLRFGLVSLRGSVSFPPARPATSGKWGAPPSPRQKGGTPFCTIPFGATRSAPGGTLGVRVDVASAGARRRPRPSDERWLCPPDPHFETPWRAGGQAQDRYPRHPCLCGLSQS